MPKIKSRFNNVVLPNYIPQEMDEFADVIAELGYDRYIAILKKAIKSINALSRQERPDKYERLRASILRARQAQCNIYNAVPLPEPIQYDDYYEEPPQVDNFLEEFAALNPRDVVIQYPRERRRINRNQTVRRSVRLMEKQPKRVRKRPLKYSDYEVKWKGKGIRLLL